MERKLVCVYVRSEMSFFKLTEQLSRFGSNPPFSILIIYAVYTVLSSIIYFNSFLIIRSKMRPSNLYKYKMSSSFLVLFALARGQGRFNVIVFQWLAVKII